jgi:hypothetical protein
MTTDADIIFLKAQLDALRAELADLAFLLDRRGQPAAVDVATMVAARLGELRDACFDAEGMHASDEIETAVYRLDDSVR